MVGKKTAHPTYFAKELSRLKLVAKISNNPVYKVVIISCTLPNFLLSPLNYQLFLVKPESYPYNSLGYRFCYWQLWLFPRVTPHVFPVS